MLFSLVPTLKISTPNMNTILEGQPITINCSASEDQVVVRWSFNGTEIAPDDERYIFSPPGLNNILTIINPNASESGNYSCNIDIDSTSKDDDERMISIIVLPGMYVCRYIL